MGYDDLDRLLTTASPMFGGTDQTHRYTYDALDNLSSWKLAGLKDYAEYVYDNAKNRLTNIRNTAGSTVVGLGYDLQGNVINKNGQGYDFDYGNRLRTVSGKESYRYDGLGRRVQTTATDGSKTTLWQYTQAGQMLFSSDWDGATYANQKTHENVYLAGSIVAIIDHNWPSNAVIATKYQHTDALGSPVAVTNAAGTVTERNDYEPYGAVIGKPTYSGIGYTGHVMDGGTGLTYMQQRYYEPSVGRFLSVDPVTAYDEPITNFNRYRYTANNPYSFKDPDGRRDIYIGGAADKDSSKIVQNYAADQKSQHPGRDIQYFGWHESGKIKAAIEAPLQKGEPLNVIGHSLGGREAISQANGTSAQITNLVTIDPVGASGNGEKPDNVATWTNVLAQTPLAGLGDVVAYAGRRLEGVADTSGADVSTVSSSTHGDFSKMMNDASVPKTIERSYVPERTW